MEPAGAVMLGRIGLAAALLILAPAAQADPAADFYRGRTLTILVGSGVGGGYDSYTRALARHWDKHIPGNPSLVVQNMPGANGITMLNFLVNQAPKDGSVIGAPFGANILEPLVDQGKATRYDPRTLAWIGNIAPQYNGCFVRADSPVKSLEDAMKRETYISATGANSNAAIIANVYNSLIGTRFKPVMGYSSAEQLLAIERKEVDGTCLSYDTLVAAQPDLVERGRVTWLVVLNSAPVAALPGTPPATRFAHDEADRQVLEFLIDRNLMGRPYVAAGAVPAERVAALRQSFLATMRDPDYLAEAKKLRMTVDPVDHNAMEAMVARVYAIPSEIVQKASALTKGN